MNKKNFYNTWQQAAEAAKSLGIGSKDSYQEQRYKDPLLPSNPDIIYGDFPGFTTFLDNARDFYRTWQEAARAARNLGIRTGEEYIKRYREDSRLHSCPPLKYQDFPGCVVFFRQKKHPNTKDFYQTWQEVVSVCVHLDINSSDEYATFHYRDKKLPYRDKLYTSAYLGFPGFPISKAAWVMKRQEQAE